MSITDSSSTVKRNSFLFSIRKNLLSFKFWRWIILLVLLATGGFMFFWMSVPQAYVSRAVRDTARDIVLGTVEVREYHRLQLRSERSGMVLETTVEIGDEIQQGQVLMRLDTEERQIDLERSLMEFENFKQSLQITRQSEYSLMQTLEDLEDLKTDVERGLRPERDLVTAERNLQQLRDNISRQELTEQLNLQTREIGIKRLRLDIEKMTIRSPVNGKIIDVFKREGDLVSSGEVLFDIIDSRRLVSAQISEEDYDKVAEGLPALVRFLAYPHETFQATVIQVLPTADPITQRYEVYLNVDLEPNRLVPGLTGEVSIIVNERENSILIPSQALIGNNVLVIDRSRINRVKVVPGFRSLMMVEILEGLREGDIVVTEELTRFRHGELVRTEWD